ncbi:hypothetical protein Pth03_69780 [Planotetraspora thailandica]|uniref:HIT domain-containing protein n=1 Tax=Planotetraspora thailandica TaxID=487172 RepID=A0A8J4DDF9_9ACTN|nr:HIT family protein [Planotetraspora thailandica]GII58589.1 hypothetical protein Pth03_69780 [Planotetraspora thailandica]
MTACPFCAVGGGEIDADLVAYRSPGVFVIPTLKQRIRNRGHMLVLPVGHLTSLPEASPALLGEIFQVAGRVGAALATAFGACGTTMFQNDNSPDQVLFHLHVHVVPRFPGDAFVMPDPSGVVLPRAERAEQAAALMQALR